LKSSIVENIKNKSEVAGLKRYCFEIGILPIDMPSKSKCNPSEIEVFRG